MERKTGFEPATPTLARWCSTTELLPHYIEGYFAFAKSLCLFHFVKNLVRVKGVEPPRLAAPDPKSGASANSATPAILKAYFYRKTMVSHEGLEPSTL